MFYVNICTIYLYIIYKYLYTVFKFGPYRCGFPHWLSGKDYACRARDVGLIPGLGRCCGEGNGSPLQYSCLGNPMDRGA